MAEKREKPREISRREFLKDAGLAVGGAAIGSTVLLAACGEGEGATETVTQTQTQTQTETVTTTQQAGEVTTTVTKTEEVSKFICPIDGMEFDTLAALQAHFTAEHPTDIPKAQGHIVQVSFDESACTGCGTCELVCATVHEGSVGPSLRRMWLDRDGINLVCHVLTCLQCDYPACYFACPLKDEALCIDSVTGARYIISDKCEPGCKVCIEACLFDTPRINFDPERNIAVKCDLCKDRVEGPACIEFCPAICLEERV